jgi:glycosyltransferase involved in cell wall biosynthesis
MMDVLMIAHFSDDFDRKGNNRFNYIAGLLQKEQVHVELVTSDFSHSRKAKRGIAYMGDSYKTTSITEPGYTKNVSIRRFFSHYMMGKHLKEYLSQRKKPDVIYCAVPSLDVAYVSAVYAQENTIKLIIDIQDLWPEAFKMVFNIPLMSDCLFYPMKKKADFIYSSADVIIAVSDTYRERALEVNHKGGEAYSVYLGTDLDGFDQMADQKENYDKPDHEIWLAYVGTLGHSYDLTSVIDALSILNSQGISSLKLVVMGDGPLKNKFATYAESKEINAQFWGRMDYGEMVSLLRQCDIAVNPISKGAAQSIINKHADYAAAGLPVVNTQECIEYRNLVVEYEMGFNCKNGDAEDLAEKILFLYGNKDARIEMGKNSRRLAEEKFDRGTTYQQIIQCILEEAASTNP